MSSPQIALRDEWSPLRRALVGRADTLTLPSAVLAADGSDRAPGPDTDVPMRTVRARCGLEIGRLAHALRGLGVAVEAPPRIGPPAADWVGSQLFVRDLMVAVDHRAVAAPALVAPRRPELEALAALLDLPPAPRPPPGAAVEGGDVLLDWPRLYVGVGGLRSNRAGVAWLRETFGDAVDVVAVPFRVSQEAHLDYCLTLYGPARGVVYRPAFPQGLPPSLADHDLIEVDRRTFDELGVNILAVDESTVVTQTRHVALREQLERRGVRTVGVDLEQHVALGGGVRCATLPLVRGRAPTARGSEGQSVRGSGCRRPEE